MGLFSFTAAMQARTFTSSPSSLLTRICQIPSSLHPRLNASPLPLNPFRSVNHRPYHSTPIGGDKMMKSRLLFSSRSVKRNFTTEPPAKPAKPVSESPSSSSPSSPSPSTSTSSSSSSSSSSKSIAAAQPSQGAVVAGVAKVVNAGKNLTYIVFVGGAIAILVGAVFVLGKDLFSTSGPYRLYDASLRVVTNDENLVKLLGEPVKGFGEGSRRRQWVPAEEFEYEGNEYMRVRFHAEGSKHQANVLVEAKKVNGKWVYTFFIIAIPSINKKIDLLKAKSLSDVDF